MKYEKVHGKHRRSNRTASAADVINNRKDYIKHTLKKLSFCPSAYAESVKSELKHITQKLKDKAKSD